MKSRNIVCAAIVAGLSVTLSACGGAPSKDDLVETIQEQDVQPGAAACIADKLLDSDLSDDQLRAIADDDQTDLSEDDIAEAQESFGKAVGSCAAE